MRYLLHDKKFHFKTGFDTQTGFYMRTGILDENGKDTGVEPFMASFPHLIDVGIMGLCIHGKTGLCIKAGVECYQSGLTVSKPNMTVEDFTSITSQCRGRTNQFALGGRGDPDQHEHFEEILKICRRNRIVPNFTTSGFGMTPEIAAICKKYCGAVAVSWYRSNYTTAAIQKLLNAGVKTNIHYVVGNNTIDEAIERLKKDSFPEGINGVIFLLHKPTGLGSTKNMLRYNDPRVVEFFGLFDFQHPYKIGIDSCSLPGTIAFSKTLNPDAVDTCEGGRFSCYISADMKMMPCSFDQSGRYVVSLRDHSIQEAWESEPFDKFRDHLKGSCPECKKRNLCMGGCPLMPEIVLCKSESREVPQ